MTTAYTSLLGLALPVTGELSGTWGDTVNNAITSLLDTAVAGTTSITTDADITLTTTTGASNQARQAIILWNPASGTTTRNITAPAQSKMYTVINASGGTQSIVIRGVGPTTGVTVLKGESALVAWNGSDFVKVSSVGGTGTFTNLTVTGNTILGDASADTLTVNATVTSNLIFTDNTYDIGASGATRPRDLFLSRNLVVGGTLTLAGGVNLNGNVTLGDSSADTLTVNSTITSNLIFTDNTYDIGASGATRPRNLYLAGLLTMGGALTVNGSTILGDAPADTITVNGTGIDINPSSGNPFVGFRTASTYRGYIEATSSAFTFGVGSAATTVLSLATTGASVTGTGSFTGDVTLGNAVAATNVNLNFNGVASKAKRIIFKSSGSEQWLIGQGAASETDAFEIYNGNGVMPIYINKTTSYVGINDSTSPLSPLDVRGPSAVIANYQQIQAISSNTAAAIDTGGGVALGGFYNSTQIAMFGTIVGRKENGTSGNYAGYLAFGTNAQATGVTEKARITSGGFVGIACTDPQADLQIGQVTGAARDIVMHTINNGNARLRFREGGTVSSGYNEYSFGMLGTDNALTWNLQGYGEVARFDTNSTLILGDTSTAASSGNSKLYIKSTLSFPLWVDTSAIAGSAFRTQTTGTTNNILVWNNSNYGYGVVGVNSATTGSNGGDVFSLGYTNSAGGAATPVVSWNSSGNAFIGGNTTAPTGVTSPFINKFDKMGGASTSAGLEYIKSITDNTATTILTVADSTKWAGTILISYVRDVDQNRSGMKMVRFAYNQTFTTLLDSSQNSGATFSVSGNNIQVTIGGAGSYYCQIQIWGAAGA